MFALAPGPETSPAYLLPPAQLVSHETWLRCAHMLLLLLHQDKKEEEEEEEETWEPEPEQRFRWGSFLLLLRLGARCNRFLGTCGRREKQMGRLLATRREKHNNRRVLYRGL